MTAKKPAAKAASKAAAEHSGNDLAAKLDAMPRGDQWHALCERFNAGERSAALAKDIEATTP